MARHPRWVRRFLGEADLDAVAAAIATAEAATSAEIRVHLDARCPGEALARATLVFERLGMHRTAARHGVLIYVSIEDRKLAVLGDRGIHERVGQAYWDGLVEAVLAHFRGAAVPRRPRARRRRGGRGAAAAFPAPARRRQRAARSGERRAVLSPRPQRPSRTLRPMNADQSGPWPASVVRIPASTRQARGHAVHQRHRREQAVAAVALVLRREEQLRDRGEPLGHRPGERGRDDALGDEALGPPLADRGHAGIGVEAQAPRQPERHQQQRAEVGPLAADGLARGGQLHERLDRQRGAGAVGRRRVEAVLEAERVVAAAVVVLRGPQPDEGLALQRDLERRREAEAQHALHREPPLGRAAAHARPLVLEAGLDLERAGRHDLGAGGQIGPVGVDVLRRCAPSTAREGLSGQRIASGFRAGPRRMAPHDTRTPPGQAFCRRRASCPSARGHRALRSSQYFRGVRPWHRRCLTLARMLHLSEEAAMRHRTRTVSLLLLLLLLLLGGSSRCR